MTTTNLICLGTASLILSATPPPEETKPNEPIKRLAWANSPDVLVGMKEVILHIGIRGAAKNSKQGEEYLRPRIEKQLQDAGLTVVTNEEAASSEWPVMLTVIIESQVIQKHLDGNEATIDSGVYLVTVNVDDIVVPARDDGAVILGATTWSRHRLGHAGRSALAAQSMDDAVALIGELCEDYAKANYRQSGISSIRLGFPKISA